MAVVVDSCTAPAPGGGSPVARSLAVIDELAGTPVRVVPLDLDAPTGIVPARLLADVGVVFLPNARPDAAGELSSLVRAPVVTDRDTTAIALTARVLATLTRFGRPPRAGRVVIAGADTMPVLCPLLLAAGIGDITTWRRQDRSAFPLRRVAAGAHAVVDLLGMWTGSRIIAPNPRLPVITPARARDPLLALPGLLRALARTPVPELDVEVLHACALALLMATPPDQQSPRGPDLDLTDRVADAATRALHDSARHPDSGPGLPSA